MSNRAGIAPWALLLFWTGLILAADLVYAVTTWRQVQSSNYAQVTGKIAQSALGQGPMGRRGLRLRYTYNIHGVNYTGTRYRYDDANVSLRYLMVLDDYQAHSHHTIYYNPNDPRDSVLIPGVDGCDLLLFLVAVPFNVASYALWILFLNYRGAKKPSLPTQGVLVLRDKDETRIRLVETSVFQAAVYGLGLAAAISAATAIALWGFDESMKGMALMWGIVLAATVGTAIWKHVKNNSGECDLRITNESLTLPQTTGRSAPLMIRRGDLEGVAVQRRVSSTPGGEHYSYLPALSYAERAGHKHSAALVRWGWPEERAVEFARWLGGEIGAEFIGVCEEEIAPAPIVQQTHAIP